MVAQGISVPPSVLLSRTLPAIALHGATDAWTHPASLPAYALVLVPWRHTRPCFVVSSVAHFAADMGGAVPSAAAHAVLALLCLCGRRSLASRAALWYMILAHVPLHYARCWASGCRLAVCACLALSGCVAYRARGRPGSSVVLQPWAQRLVCVHAWIHGCEVL